MSIAIDLARDSLLTDFGLQTLLDRYLAKGETSPQHIFARASSAFASNKEHAERMYFYASHQWLGYASPIISNAPVRTKFESDFKKNVMSDCFESVLGPLPISCFTGTVGDSREDISNHYQEMLWLASNGGGYAADWSDLRPMNSVTSTGSKTGGLIPFYHVTDGMIIATHQGNNRRGVYGGNIRDNHPEIVQFIESRKMSGDPNKRSRNVFQTVNVTDKFMYAVRDNKDWDLIDHQGLVTKTIKARYLWELMLETPFETGCPFIHFIDTSNRGLPETQKALGLKVNNLNICTEITLANDRNRTAVCCLSSVNMLKYDEWKDHPMFIQDMTEFLDNVLEYFIQNAIYACTKDFEWDKLEEVLWDSLPTAEPEFIKNLAKQIVEKRFMGMRKAVFSASQERAIGIGMMGLDSYFKSKELAYESREALDITHKATKGIKVKYVKATLHLGKVRGEAPDMVGTGRRNSHGLAIAPTATNSTIAGGVTPALEPRFENIYMQKTKSGTFEVLEPFLAKVLDRHSINNPKVRKSIIDASGSVQHLPELTDNEKKVLRTAFEVDQLWVVEHGAVAQESVCQAISMNLFFMPGVPRKYVNAVHFHMWKRGLKSRYYPRTKALKTGDAFADKIELANTIDYARPELFSQCLACE